MIDIHSHLLYGIDDGSKTLDESISIIKDLNKIGIKDIVLTPHYINYTSYSSEKDKNLEILEKLKIGLKEKNIKTNLYLGNEIYIDDEILKMLKEGKISTLNDSEYILIELPMSGEHETYLDIFLDLINAGYKVVLAHPERYVSFQENFDKLYELKEIGVLFQCNIGSILGDYGKKASKLIKKIIKEEMVDFFATDIHHKKSDYDFLNKAVKKLKKMLTDKEIKDLLENNAKKIIM